MINEEVCCPPISTSVVLKARSPAPSTTAPMCLWDLPESAAATHVRNHYLHIDRARLPEFYQRLEAAARGLAEEFAVDGDAGTEFLNVLLVATPV